MDKIITVKVPYFMFNRTKMVRAEIHKGSKCTKPMNGEWDTDLWIGREEDGYAMLCDELSDKRILVVRADDWRFAQDVSSCYKPDDEW